MSHGHSGSAERLLLTQRHRILKEIPGQEEPRLQHVRRVATKDAYPEFLRKWCLPSKDKQYIYLGVASMMPRDELITELSRAPVFSQSPAQVLVIRVPLYPPVSLEQAADWSERYWPTNYLCSNIFGPNPKALQKATSALEKNNSADKWMKLASDVATEAAPLEQGHPVGTVIIERSQTGAERVVAVAADARWGSPHGCCGDNPVAHSVMRAINMVSRKNRLQTGKLSALSSEEDERSEIIGGMTPTERKYLSATDTLGQDGYLCLSLLVFTTHEPCVMCSMALVHSRVAGLVFAKSMDFTGGMMYERPSGHGSTNDTVNGITNGDVDDTVDSNHDTARYALFWREDLNWRFLAWQWKPRGGVTEELAADLPDRVHA